MGVSIDARVYRTATVVKQMEAFLEKYSEHRRPEATVPPADFIEKVVPVFGVLVTDGFVMVYNEYYEDFNPVLNFLASVNMYYFGTNDIYGLTGSFEYIFDWLGGDNVPGGAEVLDVDLAEKLGLDYPGETY